MFDELDIGVRFKSPAGWRSYDAVEAAVEAAIYEAGAEISVTGD
jgi:hypothetical protein